MSDSDKWYRDYWKRLQVREQVQRTLGAPCLHWWWCDGLNEVEQVLYDRARDARRILDVGAGDGRLKRKFRRAGEGTARARLTTGQT